MKLLKQINTDLSIEQPQQSCAKTIAHNTKKAALTAAFSQTLPILMGFLFLGIAYGIYMNSSGFGPFYPIVMAAVIFAGSMEFVTVNLLLSAFHPTAAFLLALMVNARHLFYGLAMLEKYNAVKGWKKYYLIFGMCDESFSINCTSVLPKDVDKHWFMFFVTLLNHLYWVIGAAIGGFFGSVIQFNTEGLFFVMTALFVVIFIEQWQKETNHFSSILWLSTSLLFLVLFGSNQFIVPTMLAILSILTLYKNKLQRTGDKQ